MKTWEMIKTLMEYPEAKFMRQSEIVSKTLVCMKNNMIIYEKSGKLFKLTSVNLQANWVRLWEADFMTAFKAWRSGKTIIWEDDKYQQILRPTLLVDMEIRMSQIDNGKWYIIED